jgi:dissimilatory sulfite reductase (desulfoviridin) alpha/beta subunit
MAEKLDAKFEFPNDVRIHWTGCPNTCSQIQVGDIGLIGCTAKNAAGQPAEAVDIYVGGGIGQVYDDLCALPRTKVQTLAQKALADWTAALAFACCASAHVQMLTQEARSQTAALGTLYKKQVVVDEGLYAELEKIVIERFGALPKKQVAHALAAQGLIH